MRPKTPFFRRKLALLVGTSANLIGMATVGCDAMLEPPVCSKVGYFSAVFVMMVDYIDARGRDEDARFELCIDTLGCTSTDIHWTDAVPEGVECRVDLSLDAPRVRCTLSDDGTLEVGIALDGIAPEPSTLAYEVTVTQGGVPIEAPGTIVLEAQYPDGEACGITHVLGTVWVDAGSLAQVSPP